ncbi:MAG: septum formation protein Maf [Clostridiales bacterium]|nr:septum formation protein Maf [Clostridiales bacterium]
MGIILASKSPRRSELLTKCGFTYKIAVPEFNEDAYIRENTTQGMPVEDFPLILARGKAIAASRITELKEGDIILSADTSVILGNNIMGKPKDKDEAFNMLNSLQSNTHTVVTGVALLYLENGKPALCCDKAITRVTMQGLSKDEINEYIAKENVYDKAGAYAIQGCSDFFIEEIRGSYSNVVGLPMGLVRRLLKKINYI